MAKLYSRTGATAHQDAEGVRYEPEGDGGFIFPDHLSDLLLRQHVHKKPMWEDEEMRSERMHAEAEQRQRDPAVLYAAVTELVQLSRQAQGAGAPSGLAAELAELRRELAELRAGVTGEAMPADKAAAEGDADPAGGDNGEASEAAPEPEAQPKRKPAARKPAA